MNFLAHFFLGRQKEEYLVGNFIGDFVKGKDYKIYSTLIQEGILMHRRIDSFIDSHDSFLQTKKLLFHRYRHYSGVVADIYYDYFLAKNWSMFCDIPLDEFISSSYSILDQYQSIMPFSAQVAFKHMYQGDWLNKYTNYEGLTRTFYGMSKYIKHKTEMANAVEDLILHEEIMNSHFLSFFPQVILEVN